MPCLFAILEEDVHNYHNIVAIFYKTSYTKNIDHVYP